MKNPLARLRWFVFAPVFLGAVVVAAFAANYLGADYFKRTRLDEPNPLVAAAIGAATASPSSGAAGVTPTATGSSPSQPAVSTATGPVVLLQGDFRDGEPGHRGSGTAMLGRDGNGKPVLVLTDFSVTNGPDLHVILGRTADGGGEGVDLGELKATDGTFSYAVPEDADLSSFRSVTIWCASFPTVFAVATLEG
jgi:hypothetical protein